MNSSSASTARILGIALAALLAAGCATQYVAPTSGPTAKLRVMLVSDEYFLTAGTYSDDTCKGSASLGLIGAEGRWVRKGYAETSYLNMLDGTDKPDAKRKERLIAADRPFGIALTAMGPVGSTGGGLSTSSCNMAVSFTPKANQQYELLHLVSGETCHLIINELSQADSGAVTRTPVRDVKQLACR